jgi:glycerophosphoryl diester phosphodiesterase
MAAFRLAAGMGAEAVELDARLTRDQQVVLLHDRAVDRTTDGHGLIGDLGLEQVRRLDAGAKHDPAFRGEPVPTLDQVFEELGAKLLFNIHLSNTETPFDELVDRVVAVVREHGMGQRVLVSSFHPLVLRTLRARWAGLPIGLLLWPPSPALVRYVFRQVTPYEALHPEDALVDTNLVAGEHRAGRTVNVWTVDDPVRIGELVRMGVDGVITNAPDIAREAIRDARHSS